MNILVTGGAGYKGVRLVKRLLAGGHAVTLLDNFMYGYGPVLHLVAEPNLKIFKMDIRNLHRKVMEEFDVVYHLAGLSGMPACAANPSSAQAINVDATQQLVNTIAPKSLLIYASTTSIYGAVAGVCDETTPVTPHSLYAQTKHAGEQIVQERDNSISLRFATVFGVSPRMRDDLLVNDFTYRAINDRSLVLFAAHSKRTFLHIDDAIEAYVCALENAREMAGNVYNVGHEDLNFSKMDIAQAILKHVQFEIVDSSLPDRDVRDFTVSFEKIRALGFSPRLTLEDGIRDLLKLYGFYRTYQAFNVI